MAYQMREGQGSLFPNQKQNDRQPDFKGSVMIKGVIYNISAWNRTSQNGTQYMSLQAEERTSAPAPQQGQVSSPAPQYSAPQYNASQYNASQSNASQYANRPVYQAPPATSAPASTPAANAAIDEGPMDIVDDLPF